MMPILIAAGIAAPPSAAAPENAPGGKIEPPTGRTSRDPQASYEGETERKERLTRAGIMPKPSQRPEPAGALAKEFFGLARASVSTAPAAAGATETLRLLRMRAEISAGSWFPLKSPAGTDFGQDFSHGFGFWLPLSQEPTGGTGWAESWFVGPVAHFFNGWVTVPGTGLSGLPVPVFAEWNSSEFGVGFLRQWERMTAFGSTTALDLRLEALPLRHTNTVTYSLAGVPVASEARARLRYNGLGFGAVAAVAQSYARAVSAGAFVSLHAASPFQLKARVGLTFGLQLAAPDLPAPAPAAAAGSAPSPTASPAPSSPQPQVPP